jgi:hypothetical protein
MLLLLLLCATDVGFSHSLFRREAAGIRVAACAYEPNRFRYLSCRPIARFCNCNRNFGFAIFPNIESWTVN